ncbi:MAG: alpha/beta hydrolase [Bacteroidales bacterium]|nr:alpha/beta hydrolase [Bacteroidales bacterium]
MKQKICLAIIFCVFSVYCFPQDDINNPLNVEKYLTENGERLLIHSRVLNQEKEIYIGLPANYNDTTEYPLVIVLEGEVVFESFAPVTRLAGQMDEIPHCIVVGIPFHNKHLEYAPVLSAHPQSGFADTMLQFYRQELFPLLESRYPCTSDRIIWTHSALGGIFGTYLLIGPDNQFTGIISSSPALKWMTDYMYQENIFKETAKKGKLFYYLTFGSNEAEAYMGEMYQKVQEFRQRLENEAPDNLIWQYQLNENNNHFTNAVESYIDGLILYFKLIK